MVSTHAIGDINHFKIFERFYKRFEHVKLSFKLKRIVHPEAGAYISFLRSAIPKGGNIILVGEQKKEDIFFIRRLSGAFGKVIAIVNEQIIYNAITDMVQLLQWKNVFVESVNIISCGCFIAKKQAKKDGAVIIDFTQRISAKSVEIANRENLTTYCAHHAIKPDFIKLNLPGGEFSVLLQSKEMLKKHKPVIVVECDQHYESRKNILETFGLLSSLQYRGFFFLDTLRIPIKNFDFDIYQNPNRDFYCSTFIFE